MKTKIIGIEGKSGYVERPSCYTEIQYFWGLYLTSDGVTEISSNSDREQYLRIMLHKNCVQHVLVSQLEFPEEYQSFVGSLLLVYQEDGRDKVTVLIVERNNQGITDSCYLKLQYCDSVKLVFLARKLAQVWISESGNNLISTGKYMNLGFEE